METELSFDVAESRKVFCQTAGGSLVELTDHQAVWNMTQNELGCVASKGYNIIQHNEVVKSLVEAVKNLNMNYDQRIRQGNNTIFIDIDFPETKLNVTKGEEFITGIRVINSYNKTTGLLILPKLSRVVCSNGMVVTTFIKGYSMRHNQKMVETFQDIIERCLNDMINSCPKLQAIIEGCLDDAVEWDIAKKVLYNIMKSEKHTLEIYDRLSFKLHTDKVTRWDLYNAITDYVSHGSQLKPTMEQAMQMKAQKLFSTHTKDLQELELPSLRTGEVSPVLRGGQ